MSDQSASSPLERPSLTVERLAHLIRSGDDALPHLAISHTSKFKRASQRPLIPHDDVIETLSPQGPDQLRACRDDE